MTIKMSDAYEKHTDNPNAAYKKHMLELEVLVLNINKGYNKALMEKCRLLGEYATFVSKVRGYQSKMDTGAAVGLAIEECIREDVLAEILRGNRNEVLGVILEEYDFNRHMETVRKEAREDQRRTPVFPGCFCRIGFGVKRLFLKDISAICQLLF